MLSINEYLKHYKKKGALTSYSYSFTSRHWELKSIETIDLFDSTCSNIRIDTRGSKIMRILPIINENINQQWISDKTRFAYDSIYKWRFISPLLKKNNKFINLTWREAIYFFEKELSSSLKKNNSVQVYTGPFLSMEDLIIPDGFSYETIQDIQLDILVDDLTQPNTFFQLYGVDNNGKAELIQQNFLQIEGHLNTTLRVPLHFSCVLLKVKGKKDWHSFEFKKEPQILATLSLHERFKM